MNAISLQFYIYHVMNKHYYCREYRLLKPFGCYWIAFNPTLRLQNICAASFLHKLRLTNANTITSQWNGRKRNAQSESIKHWDTFLPFYTVYMKKKPLHVCTMINGFLLAIFVSPMSSKCYLKCALEYFLRCDEEDCVEISLKVASFNFCFFSNRFILTVTNFPGSVSLLYLIHRWTSHLSHDRKLNKVSTFWVEFKYARWKIQSLKM